MTFDPQQTSVMPSQWCQLTPGYQYTLQGLYERLPVPKEGLQLVGRTRHPGYWLRLSWRITCKYGIVLLNSSVLWVGFLWLSNAYSLISGSFFVFFCEYVCFLSPICIKKVTFLRAVFSLNTILFLLNKIMGSGICYRMQNTSLKEKQCNRFYTVRCFDTLINIYVLSSFTPQWKLIFNMHTVLQV